MATLTPAIAQDLMWRSMTTGAPTSEFDKYGGYGAVSAMYQSSGGQLSHDAIPRDTLNSLAQTVANTGVGNLSILQQTNTPLTAAGVSNMINNGIDPSSINTFIERGIPFQPAALNAAQSILSQIPNTPVGVSAAIPGLNLSNLYSQTPSFNTNLYSQEPSFPARNVEQMQLRQAAGLPALVAEPPTAPRLNFARQFIDAGVAPETIAPETVTMAGGGAVNYQTRGDLIFTPVQEAGSTFDVSEYINPETGRFYINEFERDVVFNPELREAERVARERMTPEEEAFAIEQMRGRFGLPGAMQFARPYAEGGVASLSQDLASRGRYGDSMLVHMSPEEVSGLRALAQQQGMDMTINPQTGLPEAFSLKKLLRAIAPMAAFLPIPGIQALGLLGKSALAGAIGGFAAPGKGFNFKEGLKTGLMAFAGGKLAEGLSAAAGQAGGTSGPGGGGASSMASARPSPISELSAVVDPSVGLPTASFGPPQPSYFDPSTQLAMAQGNLPAPTAQPMTFAPPPTVSTPGPTMSVQGAKDVMTGAGNLLSGSPEASAAFSQAAGVSPTTALAGTTIGYGLLEGDKERQKFKAADAVAVKAQRDREEEYRRLFARTLGAIPMAASGGLVAMAQGGMPTFEYGGTTAPTGEPRMVQGAGDGMSDNVPAIIEGVQEARLANDEFVIPADVVADIGNGSSNAGAKKLYAMMDRIRKARHGTTEQPPEINAERILPA